MYKCINGLVNHDMDLLRHEDQHTYNTRNRTSLEYPLPLDNGDNRELRSRLLMILIH